MTDFAHLHNHTEYSPLDGIGTVKEYVENALRLNQRALGVTDHGALNGINELISMCKSAGITPVPGIEAYLAPVNPEGAKVKKPVFYGETTLVKNKMKAVSPYDVASGGAYLHMTIWAVNNTGLRNLFKLSSLSYNPDRVYTKPRIDHELLTQHSEGLVVATGCPSSEVSTRLLLGQIKEAEDHVAFLQDVFGKENVYMEVMEHNMQGVDIERKLRPLQQDLARRLNLPYVATNDCHYATEEQHHAHENFLCIQSKAKMTDKTYDEGGNRFAFNGKEYYLKSSEAMSELFPEEHYPNALTNTLVIAEMAQDVSLNYNSHLRPKTEISGEWANEAEYFKHLIRVGFEEKYGNAPAHIQEEARNKLNYEYSVLYASDFVGYMLLVEDYMRNTREKYSVRDSNGVIVAPSTGPGRGSSGGSIVSYVLGITEIDPIKYGTQFERFLGPGRGARYLIEYDDGTVEHKIASDYYEDENGKKKYVWQLEENDVVNVEEEEE